MRGDGRKCVQKISTDKTDEKNKTGFPTVGPVQFSYFIFEDDFFLSISEPSFQLRYCLNHPSVSTWDVLEGKVARSLASVINRR